MSKKKHTTREAWLSEAIELLRPMFEQAGLKERPAKDIEVLVSWPFRSRTAIGQHFPGQHWTRKKVPYVSVSPVLGEDPARVLDVLLHELVHACGISNHGKDFRKVATKLGLTGKMRMTVATPLLRGRLQSIADKLGPYPHEVMVVPPKSRAKAAKPGNRVRLVSPSDPDYVLEISRKKLENGAELPFCPYSKKRMVVA